MRLLVLGGSWFVGQALVEDAVHRGHDVTTFNRGVSQPRQTLGVHHVRGDREREDDIRALARFGPWDVVVDVAGSVPALVRRTSEILAAVADHCVFVSTISAYRDWPYAPVDEASALWQGDPDLDPGTRSWDPDAYGPLKVGCEMACRGAFGPGRLLVLRPHVVLGRHEYVGRVPWWLHRMRRGGRVLAPAPDRCIQPVDVRDLVAFLLDQAEKGVADVFNVAAPSGRQTFGDMLRACIEATADVSDEPAELTWVDEDWLIQEGVVQWTELPLWRNAAAPWDMSTGRAEAAGLRCQTIKETVLDTWDWLESGGRPVYHERHAEHGIAMDREMALIRRWLTERPAWQAGRLR